eukprot:TRINITY_DN2817_c0_g1_i1.p1 TRINITY_DN2817_c0_g1~~TRINITY_DN2817_c0_g1_i1.p1  ORF type:complete len:597 (+),score=309.63 TRINITY_DN2817_c0_g1_i1:38-1792(+)
MASSTSTTRLSREEYKKQKELEEARKAGTAPAALDEEGNEINPHIPQYISQVPWYVDDSKNPSLKHQRMDKDPTETTKKIDSPYLRGARGARAQKYEKGACKNCGSRTHKEKDCLERARKIGAKYDSRQIAHDDVIVDESQIKFDWSSKHDRWSGYDPSSYQAVVDHHLKVEEERKKQKAQAKILNAAKAAEKEKAAAAAALAGGVDTPLSPSASKAAVPSASSADGAAETEKAADPLSGIIDSDSDSEEDEDGVKLMGDESMVGQKMDSRTRTTIRVLRIREDTAKYLLNLDVNSAHYDPKTRSMRDNPTPHKNIEDISFAGENFVRRTGEYHQLWDREKFATQAAENGQEINLHSAPSLTEIAERNFKQKQNAQKELEKKAIIERYGAQEHSKNIPRAILLGQTEVEVEYTPEGTLKNSNLSSIPRSRWEEDVHPHNHTSVWGSYWENNRWGYKCCYQTVKNSICTGSIGVNAKIRALAGQTTGSTSHFSAPSSTPSSSSSAPATSKKTPDHELSSEEKLRRALEEEEKRIKGKIETDERKRSYNTAFGSSNRQDDDNLSEEQIEAYRLKRARFDDPMAEFL